jgi:hypothetical protein
VDPGKMMEFITSISKARKTHLILQALVALMMMWNLESLARKPTKAFSKAHRIKFAPQVLQEP